MAEGGHAGLAVVVMGVSASGKSTMGRELAVRLGAAFLDADDFHSEANRRKMAAGIPLTDEDRGPWLDEVGRALAAAAPPAGAVLACSALRRAYRDRLRAAVPGVAFIHLAAPEGRLAERAERRKGHFMPASLLDSQYATLEPLQSDERGLTLDATAPVEGLVAEAVRWLRR